MVELYAKYKVRDKNGNIIKYCLVSNKGESTTVTSNQLKDAIRAKKVRIKNLTYTSDGRLVDAAKIKEIAEGQEPVANEAVKSTEEVNDNYTKFLKYLDEDIPQLNNVLTVAHVIPVSTDELHRDFNHGIEHDKAGFEFKQETGGRIGNITVKPDHSTHVYVGDNPGLNKDYQDLMSAIKALASYFRSRIERLVEKADERMQNIVNMYSNTMAFLKKKVEFFTKVDKHSNQISVYIKSQKNNGVLLATIDYVDVLREKNSMSLHNKIVSQINSVNEALANSLKTYVIFDDPENISDSLL